MTKRKNTGLPTHRMSNTSEFKIWAGMIQRCTNPKRKAYEYYGGRGITVCARWLNSFENFYQDVGPRPTPKHTLDRYPNNDGNYEPGNVRWATAQEQRLNSDNIVELTFQGKTMTQSAWANSLGLPLTTIRHRLKRGHSIDQVLSPAPIPNPQKKTSWPPCARCLDPNGRIQRATPYRYNGARFGISGEICDRCYRCLLTREHRAKKRKREQ